MAASGIHGFATKQFGVKAKVDNQDKDHKSLKDHTNELLNKLDKNTTSSQKAGDLVNISSPGKEAASGVKSSPDNLAKGGLAGAVSQRAAAGSAKGKVNNTKVSASAKNQPANSLVEKADTTTTSAKKTGVWADISPEGKEAAASLKAGADKEKIQSVPGSRQEAEVGKKEDQAAPGGADKAPAAGGLKGPEDQDQAGLKQKLEELQKKGEKLKEEIEALKREGYQENKDQIQAKEAEKSMISAQIEQLNRQLSSGGAGSEGGLGV